MKWSTNIVQVQRILQHEPAHNGNTIIMNAVTHTCTTKLIRRSCFLSPQAYLWENTGEIQKQMVPTEREHLHTIRSPFHHSPHSPSNTNLKSSSSQSITLQPIPKSSDDQWLFHLRFILPRHKIRFLD